jgi:hypothetical protein
MNEIDMLCFQVETEEIGTCTPLRSTREKTEFLTLVEEIPDLQ